MTTYLDFDGTAPFTWSGWTYSTLDDGYGSYPAKFSKDGTTKYFKWYNGDDASGSCGPDYGFFELDTTKTSKGSGASLKMTITGGFRGVQPDGTLYGQEITNKAQYLAHPEYVGAPSYGGGYYIHMCNGGYTFQKGRATTGSASTCGCRTVYPRFSAEPDMEYSEDFRVIFNLHNPDGGVQPCIWSNAYSEGNCAMQPTRINRRTFTTT